VFKAAGVEYYVTLVRENLERARALLDERRQGEAAAGR
jgi:hypothetical protein